MKTSVPSIIKHLLLLALALLLLTLAFKGQDIDRLLSDLKAANYSWVLASAIIALLGHVLRAVRWNLLIETLGYNSPRLKHTFYAVMIGYMANLALPRMGEVSRCGVINKTDNIPVNQLIGTVIIERLADFITLIVIIAIAIMLQFKLIFKFIYDNVFLALTAKSVNFSVLAFSSLILLISVIVFFYIIIKKDHWHISKTIRNLWKGLAEGFTSVKDLQRKGAFILYSLSIWFTYYLSTYLCFFALNSTADLGFTAALSVLVFGSIGMIAPVQGGMGAYHWMVAEGLTLYAVERGDGLAYATIIHSSQTLSILLIGSVSLIMVMVISSKQLGNGQTRLSKA